MLERDTLAIMAAILFDGDHPSAVRRACFILDEVDKVQRERQEKLDQGRYNEDDEAFKARRAAEREKF